MTDAILRAERISKTYPGTLALDHVDFQVRRGQVNVLIGENGAGKSTLAKILAGVERPTQGRLALEGEEIRLRSPRDADRYGIGMIYQELSLFPNLSVAENIFMAREVTAGRLMVDHKAQERRARALLERLEQPIDPRTLAGELPLGQQQLVEIARALARDVRILIMDEPTSALSAAEINVLFGIIRELKSRGVSIVYISHRLEELLEIGDQITVLRDGRLIAEAPADAISLGWLVEKMTGRSATVMTPRQKSQVAAELLKVNSLSLRRADGRLVLDGVSFTVHAGEILGIYGLMGAGRTELLESLIGVQPRVQGAILLEGRRLEARSTAERIAAGLVLVPEDRQRAGLVPTLSVQQNVTLMSLGRFVRGFYLSPARESAGAERLTRELRIKVSDLGQPVTSLSGGNQQKVVVAKCLLTSPKVLLMDEPTRGVDVAAKAEICETMRRLAAQGLGVVFASSELKEILAVAGRVLVMSRGRITGEFQIDQASEEALVRAASAKPGREGGERANP
jgi:erythritol transport system ATP-binding protein